MNTVKSNWNIAKGKLKQKYAQLTDDDLRYEEGKEQELLGRVQKKIGKSREELESFLRTECDCDFASGASAAASSGRPWESTNPPSASPSSANPAFAKPSSESARTQSAPGRGQQQQQSGSRRPNASSITPSSE